VAGSVAVGQSKIEGIGVFAQRRLGAGEVILAIDDSRIADELHPLAPGDDARHCDYLWAGAIVLMQTPESHINHSCDPNTVVKTVDGKRLVVAWRDVAAAEEITYDYCINSSGNTVWTCRCGATGRRRVIHSDFFHLPVERQRDYLPLLDEWFRRERRAEVRKLEELLRPSIP
jgi:SET domain-containing protein